MGVNSHETVPLRIYLCRLKIVFVLIPAKTKLFTYLKPFRSYGRADIISVAFSLDKYILAVAYTMFMLRFFKPNKYYCCRTDVILDVSSNYVYTPIPHKYSNRIQFLTYVLYVH